MSKQINKIYIADDHTLVANGFASILYTLGYDDISVFASGKELFTACLGNKPDLVFLDIHMTNWDGITTLKELRRNNFTMPIIILSMLAEKKIIENSIAEGANAYLHKSSNEEEFEEAIKTVTQEKIYISKKLIEVRKEIYLPEAPDDFKLQEPITEREMEILLKFCDGMSIDEISSSLFISERTVETHKKNLMQKFNVKALSKMIALAFKHKIIK
jgi:DNA-binding NarL/FixJ family response regulator